MKAASFYAVYWPDTGVFKVGKAWKSSRLRHLTATGGHVIVLLRQAPDYYEKAALAALRDVFPRAFANADDSLDHLPLGRGWTECFKVSHTEVGAAYKTIVRGIAAYAVQSAADVESRSVVSRSVISGVADSGTPPDHGSVALRRPAGSRERERGDVAGDVLRVRRGDRQLGGGVAVAGPRRARVVAPVFVGEAAAHAGFRRTMARICDDRRPQQVGVSAAQCRPRNVSGPTPVRFWANTGWGEGGGRRRGGVDGGPRPSASRGLPSTSQRSAYRELWALRLCSEAERRVHPGGDLSRGVDCRAPRTKGPPGSCRRRVRQRFIFRFDRRDALMSAIDVADHELIGLDANGSLCSCGARMISWLEHLGDVALVAMDAPTPRRHAVQVARDEDALWADEQQRRANLASFGHQKPEKVRRAPRPVFSIEQLAIAERVEAAASKARGKTAA
jgi:hypothetical protein